MNSGLLVLPPLQKHMGRVCPSQLLGQQVEAKPASPAPKIPIPALPTASMLTSLCGGDPQAIVVNKSAPSDSLSGQDS